jgi:hypothetical protein
MADVQFFDAFTAAPYNGVHNFGVPADVKIALSNTAPTVATDDALADITQIANGGGYTGGAGGGYSLTSVTSTQTLGVYTLGAANLQITATGASISTFRYVVIYDNSATSPVDALVGFIDNGSGIDLADGESVTVTWTTANTVFTSQEAP